MLDGTQELLHRDALPSALWGFLQPCRPSMARIDFHQRQNTYSIGRTLPSDIVLPGPRISALHCRISWTGEQTRGACVTVQDLSLNGTWVRVFIYFVIAHFNGVNS